MTATAEPEVPSPREDLYRHVNAGWLDTHEIPADQGAYGAFLELRDAAELAVRHLCEDAVREVGTGFDPAQARVQATAAAGAHRDVPLAPLDEEDAEGTEHPELKRRIAALYASFMDDETVEARGLEPIASDLAAVATVSTPAELLALSGRLQRQGVSGLINTGALNDAGNPDRMLLHLLQGGLGLPDESYYRDEAYAEILEQYTEHTGRLLALAGIGADRDEAAALGVRVVELEKRIAALHWDLVRSRDAVARYNPMTHDRLTELFPLADAWLEGVDAAGERAAEVVVWQPDFLSGVQGLLEGPEAADLEDWWTEEDRAAFTERTSRLVAQYNALSPAEAPDHRVNGEFTLGENIGDLGGLGIAHRALEIWRDEGDGASLDAAAGDREFFTAWATVWRQLTRPEAMVTRIASDPHSPNEFRCNQVVKNLDAFHEAFGTREGDPMWLAPEERVTIW